MAAPHAPYVIVFPYGAQGPEAHRAGVGCSARWTTTHTSICVTPRVQKSGSQGRVGCYGYGYPRHCSATSATPSTSTAPHCTSCSSRGLCHAYSVSPLWCVVCAAGYRDRGDPLSAAPFCSTPPPMPAPPTLRAGHLSHGFGEAGLRPTPTGRLHSCPSNAPPAPPNTSSVGATVC